MKAVHSHNTLSKKDDWAVARIMVLLVHETPVRQRGPLLQNPSDQLVELLIESGKS
jgi:hypothetical protein